MLIYEVNLKISEDIYSAYSEWLLLHCQQMLLFRGFRKAEILREQQSEPDNYRNLTVCYVVEDNACLQEYFQHHAGKMREEGIKKFGNKFTATRRVFEIIQVLTSVIA